MEIKNIKESIVFSDKTLTKRLLFADRNSLSFVLNLKAGQTLPSHKHEKSTLVLNVLNGKGKIRVNQETEQLENGVFLSVRGEDDFEIPEVTEDMSLLVTLSPNPSNEIYAKEVG